MNAREYLNGLFLFSDKKNAEADTERIISSFSGFTDIANTDKYILETVIGCSEKNADFLRLVSAITSRRIVDKFKNGKKYSQNELKEYMIGLSFGLAVETVHLILFDNFGKMIDTVHLGDGVVNSAGFIPRKMLDVAVRKNAKSAILTHNHPTGVAKPSENDLNATYIASTVLANVGIKLTAHYIVSGFKVLDCLPIVVGGNKDQDSVGKPILK